ncbi:MAG: PAS domain-containing protein, partial [Desulfobacterales bacterium]|nr:PAS domain-containing protein [Desulfobacterales bacterium]
MIENLKAIEEIIDNSSVIIFLWRFVPGIWPVEFVSKNVETTLGYTKEEFMSGLVSWTGITHQDDALRLEKEVEQFLQDDIKEWSQEYRLFSKSGYIRWIKDYNKVITDSAGNITHIQAVITDITSTREAEYKSQETENKYKRIIEELKDEYFFYSHGIDGVFTYLSSSITDVLGYFPDEFMTHYSEYLTKSSINEEAVERTNWSIKGIRQPSYEVEILHKDGYIKRLEVSEIPVFDKEGQVISIEGIAHDITKHIKTEELLKKESYVNRAIAHLNNKILYSQSIEDISHFILEYAQKFTDSPFGFVAYLDNKTGYMISPTMTREIWDMCNVKDKDIIFKEFRGLWGWVLNNHKPILTNNPSEDSRSTGVPSGHIPIKRFISVPSLINEKLVGQIALANSNRDYTI